MTDLQKQLFALQDEKYREFHCRLIPGVDEDRVIGIRVPVLRKFAKNIQLRQRMKKERLFSGSCPTPIMRKIIFMLCGLLC